MTDEIERLEEELDEMEKLLEGMLDCTILKGFDDCMSDIVERVMYLRTEQDGTEVMVVPNIDDLVDLFMRAFRELVDEFSDTPTRESVIERTVSLVEEARILTPPSRRTDRVSLVGNPDPERDIMRSTNRRKK
ncbi:MAG: hypothetical protein KDA74_24115 [Planctomycetaceae bacterium]|nr:hypothetical protein [Planctomycetaceae bacterium]